MSANRVIRKLNKKSIHPSTVKNNLLAYLGFVLVSVCISFIICFLVLNLLIRVPDIYAYTIKNNKAISSIGGDITDDDVADTISSFFQNREDSPTLTLFYNGSFENVFSKTTIKVLKGFRNLLNKSLIICIVMLVVLILSLIYLFYQQAWKTIRNSIIVSGGFLLGFYIFLAINILSKNGFSKLSVFLTGTHLNQEEIFTNIVGKEFFLTLFIVFNIITVALFALYVYTLNYIKRQLNLGK